VRTGRSGGFNMSSRAEAEGSRRESVKVTSRNPGVKARR